MKIKNLKEVLNTEEFVSIQTIEKELWSGMSYKIPKVLYNRTIYDIFSTSSTIALNHNVPCITIISVNKF